MSTAAIAYAALLAHQWVLALLERPVPQRALTTPGCLPLSELSEARPGDEVRADDSGCPLGHDFVAIICGRWRCLEPLCAGSAVLCGECHELHEGLVSTDSGDMCALCAEMAYACSDVHGDERALSAGGVS